MKRALAPCLVLMLCLSGGAFGAGVAERGKAARTISGIVYFTNDSPEDYTFLVELFEGRAKRRVAAKWTIDRGHFEFKGLRPGVYYVQVSGSNICLLQYEVDATRGQPERLQVFGDADCGRQAVPGLPEPRPVPRAKKR